MVPTHRQPTPGRSKETRSSQSSPPPLWRPAGNSCQVRRASSEHAGLCCLASGRASPPRRSCPSASWTWCRMRCFSAEQGWAGRHQSCVPTSTWSVPHLLDVWGTKPFRTVGRLAEYYKQRPISQSQKVCNYRDNVCNYKCFKVILFAQYPRFVNCNLQTPNLFTHFYV